MTPTYAAQYDQQARLWEVIERKTGIVALECGSPRALIAAIDKQIDAGRKRRNEPGHFEREQALFLQRGLAQVARDHMEDEAARRPTRTPRPKKCPTCGHHTLRTA